jgi:hypothetical protein
MKHAWGMHVALMAHAEDACGGHAGLANILKKLDQEQDTHHDSKEVNSLLLDFVEIRGGGK